MGRGHDEGVDGSPLVVRPKKIANVDRLSINCSGNLGPLFMPALVYNFARRMTDICGSVPSLRVIARQFLLEA